MASIKETLNQIKKDSMKSGDKATLEYARNLHAAVRKKEIDSKEDLDDAGVIKIIQSLAKQRNDSIEQFKKGGRDDLVANEQAELKFLQQFLPAQMGDDELKKIVEAAVKDVGASSPKDMGKVMQKVLPQVQGKADGKRISQFVQAALK